MSAEHLITAPGSLAALDAISPWHIPASSSFARRWLARLVEAWREGVAQSMRAGLHHGHWWWLG